LVAVVPVGDVTVPVGFVIVVPVVLATSAGLAAEVVAGTGPVGLPVTVETTGVSVVSGFATVGVEAAEVGGATVEVPVTVLDFS
jgi:hypothetical protein